MFHFGHAKALEQAKKSFPNVTLIVGVCSDADTHAYKGKTVMDEAERTESVRHCKWVDEVLDPRRTTVPWVITRSFLDKHNIDYVAHDALPYADASGQTDDVYAPLRKIGRFYETQRTDGVSTSDLILRILRDYNDYVKRNLQRGYTRKELNLSWSREKRIQARENVQKISQKVKDTLEHVVHGGEELVHKMTEEATQLMTGFVRTFENNYRRLGGMIHGTLQRAVGVGGSGGGGGHWSITSSPEPLSSLETDDRSTDSEGGGTGALARRPSEGEVELRSTLYL